jgi:hypothetical protein
LFGVRDRSERCRNDEDGEQRAAAELKLGTPRSPYFVVIFTSAL